MTNFKRQIVSAAAAGALFLNIATPALAETNIVISGNGAGSDNWTTVNQTSTTSVTQNNTANVTNNVNADANTGGNDANFNTGGNVEVHSGNATTDVDVTNVLNSNSAEVDCCGANDTEVEISGNGAKSENGVKLGTENKTTVSQDNDARVRNNIDTNAKTGYNDAGSNTGGDVEVTTGNAKAYATVSTTANVNAAHVGGAGSSNPSAKFVIKDNGAGSDNYIGAELSNGTEVDQENDAHITNDVDADAKTGGNDANFNTGGNVEVTTGGALTDLTVDNAVNFNSADVDCGCVWDVLAKIAGNGAEKYDHESDTDNIIELSLDSFQTVGQDNEVCLNNDVDGDAKTGDNDANSNTGDSNTDPSVTTGNAVSATDVANSGNVNSVGDMMGMPEMPDFEFDFNFAALWAFFGSHM